MSWYAEKGTYDEKGPLSLDMDITPYIRFSNFKEAMKWYKEHSDEPVSIWFDEKGDDENDDPSGKISYGTKVFLKYYQLFRKFQEVKTDLKKYIRKI